MIRWILYFIPALIVELICWVLTPLVCLFVVRRLHTDKVKRYYNKQTVTLMREFLPDWLSLFGTPDNAVDEFFMGMYSDTPTEGQYHSSWFWRYYCRCMWLFRNTAYGWHYLLFSVPAEEGVVSESGTKYEGFWYKLTKRPSSFQLQYQLPIPFTKRYIDGNIGWKSHGFDTLMYANRFIGLRSYK